MLWRWEGGSPANDLKSLTGQRSFEDPLPGHNRVLFFLRAGTVYSALEHGPLTLPPPPPPPSKTSCGDADSASDFSVAAVIYSVLCGNCNLIVKRSKTKIFDERDKEEGRDSVTASCGRFDWKMSSGPVFQKYLQAMKIIKSLLRDVLKLRRPFVSPPTH